MNKMKRITTALALMGCAASGSALAQSAASDSTSNRAYQPSWYIAPSINAIRPDDRFGSDHHGEGAGLRIGKAISPKWDIQFGTTYSRQRYNGVRYEQDTLGVDGLYLFSRNRFRPFVLLGAGVEYDKTEIYSRSLKRHAYSPYVNAGIGFQFSFSERWGMQADVRRAHSYLTGDEFAFDRASTNIATLGLTFAFDKRAAPLPVTRMAPEPASAAPAPAVAAAPPPAATPAPTPPRFERFTLSATELFAFDRAELRMPQQKLDEIADVLKRNAQVGNVTITGYTDRLGSDQYNMQLSQRRADAVKTYLANKGVEGSRLSATGKGESNPVVQCNGRKRADLINCLEPNRRVEVEQIVIERRIP